MIDLFFFELSPYTLGIVLGAACALTLSLAYAHQARLPASVFWSAALAAVPLGLLGARLLFVGQHLDFYGSNPDEVFDFRAGGLAWHGALLGGGGALLLVAVGVRFLPQGRWQLGPLADAAAVGLPWALALGWVGAYAVGAHYGAPSDSLLSQELPDAFGIYDLRYPVQLFAAGWYALGGGLLLRLAWPPAAPRFAGPHPAGRLTATFLLWFATGDLSLAFLRGEELVRVQGLTVGQWLDLALGALGLLILVVAWRRAGRLAPRRVLAVEWDK